MSDDEDDHDGAPDADGYAVGYRKPPVSKQFKKGTSGNMKGRPRRKATFDIGANMDAEFAEVVTKEASRLVQVREGGRVQQVPMRAAMLRMLMNAGLKGDTRSQVEAMKIVLAAERYTAEQKEKAICPTCAALEEKSGDEIMEEIMDLLTTGRVKLPAGVEIIAIDDEDDDPWGVG